MVKQMIEYCHLSHVLHLQSDGTAGKGSRDELGLTLNDFQRKSHSGGYRGSGDQVASGDDRQAPGHAGHDHNNDIDNRSVVISSLVFS